MIKAYSWRLLSAVWVVASLIPASEASAHPPEGGQASVEVHVIPSPDQTQEQPPPGSQQVIIVPSQEVPPPEAYVSYGQGPNRLQTLELRLAELRAERSRYRIGGSIAMMGIGGGLAIVGGSVAWVLWESLDWDPYNDSLRRAAIGFSVVGAVGGSLFIFGTIKLARRLRMRRRYDPEIRQIRDEIRRIRLEQQGAPGQYYYGAALDLGFTGNGVGARLRF